MRPPEKMEWEIERKQIKPDLEITHQGQCAHQVSSNLADPDFPGLTRFLSQGLLIVSYLLTENENAHIKHIHC